MAVASLLLETSSGGTSLGELIDFVRGQVARDADLLLRVDEILGLSLGTQLPSAAEQRFDAEFARSSLQYFEASKVAKPSSNLPPEVSDVRFRVDLSRIDGTGLQTLRDLGGLFSAL